MTHVESYLQGFIWGFVICFWVVQTLRAFR
jgi:hypothetical protein